MNDLSEGDLSIAVDETASDRIVLSWTGKSNDRYPKRVLAPFLEGVTEAAAAKGAMIVMRFDALEYLNSSTISALVGVIRELRERNLRLVIRYDAEKKWQKLCFEALRVFEKPDGLLEMKTVS